MEKDFTYSIRKHARARSVRLSISPSGRVVVTKPYFVSNYFIDRFVQTNKNWILEQLKNNQSRIQELEKRKVNYIADKEKARDYLYKKLEYYSKLLGIKFNKVFIKNQRTVWGSCSRRNNLNFSYRLLYLPEGLADYIVVHELCHIKEMNHSIKFWNLVESIIPDYKVRRKQIKQIK